VLNNAYGGRPYRYAYAATGVKGWFLFDGLVRHDLLTGSESATASRAGCTAASPPWRRVWDLPVRTTVTLLR
jgi:carotenoid cleavage dioxygenase